MKRTWKTPALLTAALLAGFMVRGILDGNSATLTPGAQPAVSVAPTRAPLAPTKISTTTWLYDGAVVPVRRERLAKKVSYQPYQQFPRIAIDRDCRPAADIDYDITWDALNEEFAFHRCYITSGDGCLVGTLTLQSDPDWRAAMDALAREDVRHAEEVVRLLRY